jgi:putative hydrolase of the HAD superfamily
VPPDADVAAVVFDLGGVLADFGGVAPMRTLAGFDSDAELWERWLSCEPVRRFERGAGSAEEFAAALVAEWQLAVEPDRFLADFRGWLVGPYDGAEALVKEVKAQVPVACLSNTNRVARDEPGVRGGMRRLFRPSRHDRRGSAQKNTLRRDSSSL